MVKTVFVKKRRKFLAFLSMVINCAAEAKRKSERIEMVVDAVRKIFDIVGVSAEEVQAPLREAFRLFQSLD